MPIARRPAQLHGWDEDREVMQRHSSRCYSEQCGVPQLSGKDAQSVVQNLMGWLTGLALSAVRIVVSFLLICHGAAKLFGAFGGVDDHGAAAPVGSWPTWWAGVIELGAGGLVLLGLLTRVAALLCSGAMAFAYFTVPRYARPRYLCDLLPAEVAVDPATVHRQAAPLVEPVTKSLGRRVGTAAPCHRATGGCTVS